MSRLYSLTSWFFNSLGIALAVLVPLTVPEDVFADAGSSCSSCSSGCTADCHGDNYCYETCLADCAQGCCSNNCSGNPDPSCGTTCCQEACGDDQPCINYCEIVDKTCDGDCGCNPPGTPPGHCNGMDNDFCVNTGGCICDGKSQSDCSKKAGG